jgi:hypothetical protein
VYVDAHAALCDACAALCGARRACSARGVVCEFRVSPRGVVVRKLKRLKTQKRTHALASRVLLLLLLRAAARLYLYYLYS